MTFKISDNCINGNNNFFCAICQKNHAKDEVTWVIPTKKNRLYDPDKNLFIDSKKNACYLEDQIHIFCQKTLTQVKKLGQKKLCPLCRKPFQTITPIIINNDHTLTLISKISKKYLTDMSAAEIEKFAIAYMETNPLKSLLILINNLGIKKISLLTILALIIPINVKATRINQREQSLNVFIKSLILLNAVAKHIPNYNKLFLNEILKCYKYLPTQNTLHDIQFLRLALENALLLKNEAEKKEMITQISSL